ncbi:unnamed protein product [Caenorhabditis auriculariae]|uniref:Uncharacterized protein n=1 Tax=Caenorhabditis auriculariae TaxID=2777116 RepID=A0A8S1HII0_9PELO|nr:unnamed protein product [Caenorhabditis auriculariae]
MKPSSSTLPAKWEEATNLDVADQPEDFHYSSKSHATVLLNSLQKAQEEADHPLCNVTIEVDGEPVVKAHGALLAACSTFFESTLVCIHPPTSQITLDLDTSIVDVDRNSLLKVIRYMYTGAVEVDEKLWRAAKALQCAKLEKFSTSLIEVVAGPMDSWSEEGLEEACGSKKRVSFPDVKCLVELSTRSIRNDDHALDVLREFDRMRRDRILLDCIINVNVGRVWAHRCVLVAYSKVLQNLILSVGQRALVTLDIDPKAIFMSKHDAYEIVSFMYLGFLRTTRKDRRLKLMRIPAERLEIHGLVGIISKCIADAQQKEKDLPSATEELMFDHSHIIRSNGLSGFQIDSSSDNLPGDPVSSDYNRIYENYVEGPKRNRRTVGLLPINEIQVKGPVVYEEDKSEDGKPIPAVNVTRIPAEFSRKRPLDSFGYGLPEVVSRNDFTVPLIVGDQEEMMQKPYKCNFCDHRSRERSSIQKHIRCMHTHETPYKCEYCGKSFKIQSNLMRHIRSHTGEKPYSCKKCGVSYADKKNMDTHVYRQHLQLQQVTCTVEGCNARFWRPERYQLHLKNVHGIATVDAFV